MISAEKLSKALSEASSSSEFTENAWLTIYLIGNPQNLRSLASELTCLNASNLEGEEGGFLYAKLPVKLEAQPIQEITSTVSKLAARHAILLDHIDLDSSDDVETSTFLCLSNGGH